MVEHTKKCAVVDIENHCMQLCRKSCGSETCMCIITHDSLPGYVPEKSYEENLENSLRSLSLIEENSLILDVPPPVTARDIVLRKCGQVDSIPFQECYPER